MVRDVMALVVGYSILSGGAIVFYALGAAHELPLTLLGWAMGALCAALAGYLCVAVAGQATGGPVLAFGLGATGALTLLAFGSHARGALGVDGVIALLLAAAFLGGALRHHQDRSITGIHPDTP